MSLDNRVKATLTNVEGKLQEAMGDITGDPSQRTEGRSKQEQAEDIHATENLKDEAKTAID